jgi:hypothetical protein
MRKEGTRMSKVLKGRVKHGSAFVLNACLFVNTTFRIVSTEYLQVPSIKSRVSMKSNIHLLLNPS